MGSIVVTHPFHPLFGQRLSVVFAKKRAGRLVFVCEGGPDGRATVTVAEAWTDRGPCVEAYRLSLEGLILLDTLVTAIVDGRDRKDEYLV